MGVTEKLDHSNGFFRICVDSVEQGWVSGRIFSRRLTEPMVFSDLGSLLLQVEELLEKQDFPQAFQQMRTFTGTAPGTVASAWGKRATFVLYIITRRNASWQGKVDWLDGGEPDAFTSDLEFLKLAENHLTGLR